MTEVLVTGQVPVYANLGDAGADLRSTEENFVLESGTTRMVGTGTSIALPDGYVAFVVPRSGLAAKHGLTVLNTPGTVDAGYRGEIKVILHNAAGADYEIKKGDRIAQMVILQLPQVSLVPVAELPESARGENGFGSSGYGNRQAAKDEINALYGRTADA